MATTRQNRRCGFSLALAVACLLSFLPWRAGAEVSPPGGFVERIEAGAEPTPSPKSSSETAPAQAEDSDAAAPTGASSSLDAEFTHECAWVCYGHAYTTFKVGRGLRLNNPYRLSTPLGSSAESLSLTAPYSDFGLAVLFGDAEGFQQGGIVSLSLSLTGVPQQVLAPGYAALFRFGPRLQARGSLAFPILLQPEANIGADASVGAAWMFLAGLGLVSDVVFSLYEGAATDQHAATLIPVLSVQLGLTIDVEVLP